MFGYSEATLTLAEERLTAVTAERLASHPHRRHLRARQPRYRIRPSLYDLPAVDARRDDVHAPVATSARSPCNRECCSSSPTIRSISCIRRRPAHRRDEEPCADDGEEIALSSDANAWRITLNDPPLHILDIAMLEELRDALGRVTNDRHALIIDATGEKAFSAGASVQDHLGDRVAAMLERFHDCFRILARLDLVTVALVRGAALGGGCELALACDFVLASDRARFGQPEIQLGVFPPVAAYQLSRQLPPRKGLELILTGDPIDAATAEASASSTPSSPPPTSTHAQTNGSTGSTATARPRCASRRKRSAWPRPTISNHASPTSNASISTSSCRPRTRTRD